MKVEYQTEEVVIRLPVSIKPKDVQVMLDYFKALSILTQNKGTEEQALELARESDKQWWEKNRKRFLP